MQKFLIEQCDCNYDISCFEDKVNEYLESGYTVASTHIAQSSTNGETYTTVAVVLEEKTDKNGGK